MEQKRIEIFVFIDALGWKIVKEHKFLADVLPYQQKITMQFGYSSSAIPTILSGKTPAEHGHLGLFRFTLNDSPFKFFSKLTGCPKFFLEFKMFKLTGISTYSF